MRKVLTLREKTILNNGFMGIGFIALGVAENFKINKHFLLPIYIIALLGLFISIIAYFIKTEIEDERSEHNRNKAKVTTYNILSLIVVISVLISALKGNWIVKVNFQIIMVLILGTVNLIECMLFIIYEKIGE